MKVLFSADYHIKLGQKNVPVEWAKARYYEMFNQIHKLEESVDLHVIGGDVFDKLPSMDELKLYFEFVVGCKSETIIFAGNHESVKKDTTFFTQLKDVTHKLNPLVKVIDDYLTIGNMDFIPYNRLKDFEKDPKGGNDILFSHFRAEIPPHVKPEIDLDLFLSWKVVFAGDLHSHSNCQRNIVYPGSPCTTSFHRNEVTTGVVILDSETTEWEFVELNLPQLIRKTIAAGEPMPATTYHHTIYEVTGDMEDLGKVDNVELLDKKIVKRSTECALILAPNATLQEELVEYLRYILELDDTKVDELLQVFNDNIKGIE